MQSSPSTLSAGLIRALQAASHIAVLTGAGVSAESGVPTFRDAQTRLWVHYDPMELATTEALKRIEDAAFLQQYNVILCNTERDHLKERRYVEVLSKKQVDGIIFVGAGDQSDSLLSLQSCPIHREQLPVSLIQRKSSGGLL